MDLWKQFSLAKDRMRKNLSQCLIMGLECLPAHDKTMHVIFLNTWRVWLSENKRFIYSPQHFCRLELYDDTSFFAEATVCPMAVVRHAAKFGCMLG